MPSFKLDGQEISFESGDTIIRAAWRKGIEIPHYCWHPGLSVAANCRMCLVEIRSGRPMLMPILRWDPEKRDYVEDTKPKLQPACQMQASEGLDVATKSDVVKEAQSSVQEFLLLNHPVDCPICDQSGECKLQDYWLDHQHALKRKHTEPVHKPKGVRFGPTIVYDGERCIMCTRCIRFCDEVAHDHALDMRERGNRNEIVVAPGRELDNKYTLMTEHVCPVGALTSRDFRFKARVWFLKSAPSVCPGCATGCNMHVDYDPRNNQVYRLRPRDNMDVNKFWMCDDGMMTYKRIVENRVLYASLGRGADRALVNTPLALKEGATKLKSITPTKVAFVLSAQHSSEDNYALARLCKFFGSQRVYLAALGGWEGDKILRNSDNNPNRVGAIRAAGGRIDRTVRDLVQDVRTGLIEAIVALGGASTESAAELGELSSPQITFVSLTSHEGALPQVASIVIPVSAWAEMSGTFVNGRGRSQEFKRAVPSPGNIKPAWEIILELARDMGVTLDFSSLKDIRKALTTAEAPTVRPMEVRI